jgi:fido (protein-threonine AMPylation protein)
LTGQLPLDLGWPARASASTGITDAAELARAEAALSASRLIDLKRRRLPGRYDLAQLQAFHRCILGGVCAWADQLRAVSIAEGSVFCLPRHLESYAADVSARHPAGTTGFSSRPGWRFPSGWTRTSILNRKSAAW